MEKKEATGYFEAIRKEQIDKLLAVGFTQEQAEVLLEIMQTKAFSGGLI